MIVEAGWSVARDAAGSLAAPLPPERVPLAEACGRVLATDARARCALPYADTSAMDGWAVVGDGPWQVVGDLRNGTLHAGSLAHGEAVRIGTGGVIPIGADRVLRWERATLEGARLSGSVAPGFDIRLQAEECAVGELIAPSGTDISPALTGLLAATGHDHVAVIRRPRIALLLLGDELQAAGIPGGGRVRDSLGPQLPGWLGRMGAEIASQAQVPDDLGLLIAALEESRAGSDLVITTGSTAAGPRDHLRAAITATGGRLQVDRVAVKPGHPMLLASVDSVPIIGLPGNPHSAIVGLMTLAVPLVDRMLGRPRLPLSRVPTKVELRSPDGLTRLVAGRLDAGRFEMSGFGGSAMLRGLAMSDGFAVLPPGAVPQGADVDWLPLP